MILNPSELYSALITTSLCPVKLLIASPVFASHIIIFQSELADTIYLPSGLNAADHTIPLCPYRKCMHFCSCTSHILTDLSDEAETTFNPSGLNATFCTMLECPTNLLNLCTTRLCMWMHLSEDADAILLPLGLMDVDKTYLLWPLSPMINAPV